MKLIIRRDQKAQTGLLGGHKGVMELEWQECSEKKRPSV
jgi:hypothetical protein